MLAMMATLAAMHGRLVPLLWIVGIVLIVGGVVSLFRGSLVVGIVMIIVGVLLGGLNVL